MNRKHKSPSPSRHRDSSHRRRRSNSPGPSRRESYSDRNKKDDGKSRDSKNDEDHEAFEKMNVIERMQSAYNNTPLEDIYFAVENKRQVKVWTRNFREVRGILTGYITHFDKHWNLLMTDVEEAYLKPKYGKTPYLVDYEIGAPEEPAPAQPEEEKEKEEGAVANEPIKIKPDPDKIKKKTKRKKKRKGRAVDSEPNQRRMNQLFVRGDCIVMITEAPPIPDEEDE